MLWLCCGYAVAMLPAYPNPLRDFYVVQAQDVTKSQNFFILFLRKSLTRQTALHVVVSDAVTRGSGAESRHIRSHCAAHPLPSRVCSKTALFPRLGSLRSSPVRPPARLQLSAYNYPHTTVHLQSVACLLHPSTRCISRPIVRRTHALSLPIIFRVYLACASVFCKQVLAIFALIVVCADSLRTSVSVRVSSPCSAPSCLRCLLRKVPSSSAAALRPDLKPAFQSLSAISSCKSSCDAKGALCVPTCAWHAALCMPTCAWHVGTGQKHLDEARLFTCLCNCLCTCLYTRREGPREGWLPGQVAVRRLFL